MRRLPLLLSTLLLAATIVCVIRGLWVAEPAQRVNFQDPEEGGIAPAKVAVPPLPPAVLNAETFAFRSWQQRRPVPSETRALELWEAEGKPLAEKRRLYLADLMRTDTEAALLESLRWDEWVRLPSAVRSLSEQPFSEWVRQDCYLGCDPESGIATKELRITRENGSELRAFSYGRRQTPLSRAGVPMQGFVLGDEAALWPDALQILSSHETRAVRKMLPALASGASVSAWSGLPIGESDLVNVLIGGRLGKVRPEEVTPLRERLHAWEAIPGETTGVEKLAAWLEADGSEAFVPLMDDEFIPFAEDPWTTTPKRLLLLRIDFSDLTGARESAEVLTNKLTNDVSTNLEEMSFGKTGLIVTVTPEVIRMPRLSTYYAEENGAGRNGNGQLHDDARAGAAALGYVFDEYDFWCVQFSNISMGYGGLAIVGGKKSWIQSSGTGVFVHEFGHNYGLGHANRWEPDPVDGPLGANGTKIDYGSTSSIMGSGPFPNGHFDAQAKAFLGWLDTSQWQDVTTSGRYRLWRADDVQSPRPAQTGALRLERESAPGDSLWLSYKRAIPERRRLARGISVIWEQAGNPRNSLLVKAGRDGSYPENDCELPVGQTFSDGSVHVTPVERGGRPPWLWIDLEIRIDPTPGNGSPVASWSYVPAGEVLPFQTFRLEVSASDPDGDTLAYHWDPGDGSEVSYNGPSLVHTYTTAGLYEISVEISDMRGGKTILTRELDVASDSSDWTLRTSGTTSHLYHITASPQRAVAVSGSGLVVHSVNGTNWTVHDLKSAQGSNALDLREIRWNGSCFIIVGREQLVSGGAWEGCIYRSTDGLSWTRTHLGGNLLLRVAHGGGKWVVTGENSTMRTSTDGLGWTSVGFPETDRLCGIAYGNGLWLAIADRNNDRTWAFTSTDLERWTYHSWSESFTNNQIVRPARWMAGQYYLGGFAVGLRTVSGDGEILSVNPILSGMGINDMIEVGGSLYVVGDITEDAVPRGHVHVSVTGQSWQRISISSPGVMRGVTQLGGRLITVGNTGEIWQSGPLFAPAEDGWHSWQTANRALLGAEDDPLQVLPGSDLPNLYHYAVGSAPDSAGFLPYSGWDVSGRLKLTLPRNVLRPDVQYRILRSTDLIDWTAEGVEILIDSVNRLEALGSDPDVTGREFMRFEARLSP